MKLSQLYKFFFCLLIFLISTAASAQEFHYWNNPVGAKPSMLAGAVTAADKESSAIFYNPGALGFIENSSLSLSSDTYYFSWINIKNGAGKDMDLASNEITAFPQIVAFNQKIPKLPISITIGVINRDNSLIKMSYRNEMTADLIEELPGEEVYVGTVDYYNRLRDNWAGYGYGRKIGDYIGIGFSGFLSIRSVEYRYNEHADVYKFNADSTDMELVANVYSSDYLDFQSIGIVFLVGLTYQREKFKLGVNITMPRINLRFVGKSDLRRTVHIDMPSTDSVIRKYDIWQEAVKSTYKSPLTIDLGAEYNISQANTIYAKVSWFAPISKYSMLETDAGESLISSGIDKINPEYKNIYTANKMIINMALAFKTQVNKKIAVLVGARTDFSYLDTDAFDMNSDFYPGVTYWDIYHLSGGISWSGERFDLNLGGSFSFGSDASLSQIVNLSDPTEENYFFGVSDNSARSNYNQISIYLGFTYFFPK